MTPRWRTASAFLLALALSMFGATFVLTSRVAGQGPSASQVFLPFTNYSVPSNPLQATQRTEAPTIDAGKIVDEADTAAEVNPHSPTYNSMTDVDELGDGWGLVSPSGDSGPNALLAQSEHFAEISGASVGCGSRRRPRRRIVQRSGGYSAGPYGLDVSDGGQVHAVID